MLKLGAKFILTTMILPLIVYAAKTIQTNKEKIIVLEEKNKTQIDLLKEMREDVRETRTDIKELLKR